MKSTISGLCLETLNVFTESNHHNHYTNSNSCINNNTNNNNTVAGLEKFSRSIKSLRLSFRRSATEKPMPSVIKYKLIRSIQSHQNSGKFSEEK